MEGRTYKQCRERFMNYLKNGLNCGPWTPEENNILMEMHGKIGNKWAEIARILKGVSVSVFLFSLPTSLSLLKLLETNYPFFLRNKSIINLVLVV